MRTLAIGALVCTAVLAAAWAATWGDDRQSGVSPAASDGGLIALTTPGEGRQMLTVVDPQTKSIAVYHVELSTGEISLKSVRQIYWDLQLVEFNGASPLPSDVRSMFKQ